MYLNHKPSGKYLKSRLLSLPRHGKVNKKKSDLHFYKAYKHDSNWKILCIQGPICGRVFIGTTSTFTFIL